MIYIYILISLKKPKIHFNLSFNYPLIIMSNNRLSVLFLLTLEEEIQ